MAYQASVPASPQGLGNVQYRVAASSTVVTTSSPTSAATISSYQQQQQQQQQQQPQQQQQQQLRQAANTARRHKKALREWESVKSFFKTILLFTADDFFSIIFPNALCGILLSLTAALFTVTISRAEVLLLRAPLVFAWVWFNLLTFNLSNQRQPEAVAEDAINKPWRPLPAGRISPAQARLLNIAVVPMALFMSSLTGGLWPCISLQMLTFIYNDMGGSEHWLTRGPINAGGYLSFVTGAIQVGAGMHALPHTERSLRWIVLVAVAITSSIHSMDLYDQEGDRARDRATLPLVIGDSASRIWIATCVLAVSAAAPFIVGEGLVSGLVPLAIAAVIASRLLVGSEEPVNSPKQQKADKKTFKLWCAWVLSLYLVPVWALFSPSQAFVLTATSARLTQILRVSHADAEKTPQLQD